MVLNTWDRKTRNRLGRFQNWITQETELDAPKIR